MHFAAYAVVCTGLFDRFSFFVFFFHYVCFLATLLSFFPHAAGVGNLFFLRWCKKDVFILLHTLTLYPRTLFAFKRRKGVCLGDSRPRTSFLSSSFDIPCGHGGQSSAFSPVLR